MVKYIFLILNNLFWVIYAQNSDLQIKKMNLNEQITEFWNRMTRLGFKGNGFVNFNDKIVFDQNKNSKVVKNPYFENFYLAVLTLKLEEKKILDSNMPIKNYLNFLPENLNQLTINQLLAHHNALTNYNISFDSALTKPLFNNNHNYSIHNLTLVKKILQEVTRKNIQIVYNEHIAEPFQLKSNIDEICLEDMKFWESAILENKVLQSDQWKKIFTPFSLISDGYSYYSLGWKFTETYRQTVLILNESQSASYRRYPMDRLTIMITADSNSLYPAEQIAHCLSGICFSHFYKYPPISANFDYTTLIQIADTFWKDSLNYLNFIPNESTLDVEFFGTEMLKNLQLQDKKQETKYLNQVLTWFNKVNNLDSSAYFYFNTNNNKFELPKENLQLKIYSYILENEIFSFCFKYKNEFYEIYWKNNQIINWQKSIKPISRKIPFICTNINTFETYLLKTQDKIILNLILEENKFNKINFKIGKNSLKLSK